MNSTRFGNGKAYLITSKKLHDGLLNQLEKRWSIRPFDKPFKHDTEPLTRSNLKNLRQTEYLIYPNTMGTKYYIYLTVYSGKKYVLFISPKHEKILAAKNLFPPKEETTASLFTDTIIRAELVKSKDNSKWYLLANDLLVMYGDDLRTTTASYQERLAQLYKLEKFLKPKRFDGVIYDTNTVTDCQSLKYMITKTLPKLKYECNSVIFVPKFQKYRMRRLQYNIEINCTPSDGTLSKFMVKGEPESAKIGATKVVVKKQSKPIVANFEVNMTSKSDVYQLYYYEDDKKTTLVNFGLAYISDTEHSMAILQIFSKVKPKQLADYPELFELKTTMSCQYNEKFNKWMPLKKTTKPISSTSEIEKMLD